MKFELEEHHRNIADKEILEDIRRVANDLGQDFLTARQYDGSGKFDSSTIKRRFGGWLSGTDKAKLKRARLQQNARLAEEDLFRNIEEVWIKLGRQPRITEMFPPLSKYSAGVYKRHFGTWINGLKQFVGYVNREQETSSEITQQASEIRKAKRHKTQRDVNWRLRFLVMRRDNFKCKNCGRSPATDPSIILHVDHINAWTNGGETTLENLQTLCSKCNIGKSDLE